MIELLRFKTKEIFHKVHNMIKIDFYSFKEFKIQRQLKSCQIFEIIDILKNIYIIFAFIISNKNNFILYINNYVD